MRLDTGMIVQGILLPIKSVLFLESLLEVQLLVFLFVFIAVNLCVIVNFLHEVTKLINSVQLGIRALLGLFVHLFEQVGVDYKE